LISIPGYESSFRALSLHVLVEHPFEGDAARDAVTILQSIRRGRVYIAADGLASPPSLQFTGSTSHGFFNFGDSVVASDPVTLHVASNAPSTYTTTLWRNDRPLVFAQGRSDITQSVSDSSGAYWVEIKAPSQDGELPWIVSNPIYVSGLAAPKTAPPVGRMIKSSQNLFDRRYRADWHIESDRASRGTLQVASNSGAVEVSLHYALAKPPVLNQFVALVSDPLDGRPQPNRLSFCARADRPIRVLVGIRDTQDAQWFRSAFIDDTPREVSIGFTDMLAENALTHAPTAPRIKNVLFVIETTHTKAGSSGWLWLKDLELQETGDVDEPSDAPRVEALGVGSATSR
jgi:hypothetical protein